MRKIKRGVLGTADSNHPPDKSRRNSTLQLYEIAADGKTAAFTLGKGTAAVTVSF